MPRYREAPGLPIRCTVLHFFIDPCRNETKEEGILSESAATRFLGCTPVVGADGRNKAALRMLLVTIAYCSTAFVADKLARHFPASSRLSQDS